jgi:hypothetical protein
LIDVQKSIKLLVKELKARELPLCTLTAINIFCDLVNLSNQASIMIRRNYLDVWYEYVKRPKGSRGEKFKFSSKMYQKFGRQRVAEFYELCQRRRDLKEWFRVKLPELLSEIKLIGSTKAELMLVVEWVSNLNNGVSVSLPNDWINFITPKHIAEIALWRLMNLL